MKESARKIFTTTPLFQVENYRKLFILLVKWRTSVESVFLNN